MVKNAAKTAASTLKMGPMLMIRADANVAIGTGHVMRCLALAQAWQDAGGRAVFIMAEAGATIERRLRTESCEVVCISAQPGTEADWQETIRLAHARNADWVVVDGYQFGSEYQQNLKAAGFRVLFADDCGQARHYFADVVLNQNVGADESLYQSREPHTRLLLGPQYCMLRREFAAWRGWKREIRPACCRVLVIMGGSDPENLTARVIRGLILAGLRDLEVTVVVGGSNPHFQMLQSASAQSGLKITVQRDISNVAELMAAADVAVSAAGSTCWELCLLGLPALLIDVARNQSGLAKELERRGCAIHIGNQTVTAEKIAEELTHLVREPALRQSLSQRCQELVDDEGSHRIVSALQGAERLRLRRARIDDRRVLWEWANDAEVRAASFSPDPVPWENHVSWFDEKLSSAEKLGQKRSVMLIAEDEKGIPLGQIRFDARPDGDWEVDVSIAKAMRGQGLGGGLIKLGMQTILNEEQSARVHAFVKPSNLASVKAFERAAFQRAGTDQVRGNAAIHLIYQGD